MTKILNLQSLYMENSIFLILNVWTSIFFSKWKRNLISISKINTITNWFSTRQAGLASTTLNWAQHRLFCLFYAIVPMHTHCSFVIFNKHLPECRWPLILEAVREPITKTSPPSHLSTVPYSDSFPFKKFPQGPTKVDIMTIWWT